jgi:hypothetical protein
LGRPGVLSAINNYYHFHFCIHRIAKAANPGGAPYALMVLPDVAMAISSAMRSANQVIVLLIMQT